MYIAASTSIYLAIIQYYRYVHAPYMFLCLLGLHRAPDWCHYSLAFPPEVKCHYWKWYCNFLCRDLSVAFCICLCLFLHCIKTLLSLINNLFIPVHLILHKLFEEQYLCILQIKGVESCGQTLSQVLFSDPHQCKWPLQTGFMIASWCIRKGRQLVFASNAKNVFSF